VVPSEEAKAAELVEGFKGVTVNESKPAEVVNETLGAEQKAEIVSVSA